MQNVIGNKDKYLLFIFCVIVFILSVRKSTIKNDEWSYSHMISWDSEGYYIYLPAVLVNHSFENLAVRDNVRRMIEKHQDDIINYFKEGQTNAKAENMNGKIQRFLANNYGIRDRDFFLYRLAGYFL